MNNIRQCWPVCRRVPYVIIIIISMCDSVRQCSTVQQGEWQCARSARGSVQQCTCGRVCMAVCGCAAVVVCDSVSDSVR